MESGPKTLKELRHYIRRDLKYVNGHPWRSFFSRYFGEAGFHFTVWLRVTRYFFLKGKSFFGFFLLSRMIMKHYAYKYSFDISFRAQIGPGLTIAHYGYIIVPSNAVIGENCALRPGIVFGKKLTASTGGPTVGDDVNIGVGTTIVGDVSIGDRVVIGANSVVTRDVPSDCVIAGAPARVIRKTGDSNSCVDAKE